ncbi:MAG: hypothetical protein V4510_07065 [bacterium]
MGLDEAIRQYGRQLHADVDGGDGHWVVELTLAERHAGSELRHLRYRLNLDEEEGDAVLYFEDTLWERVQHPGLDLGGALREKEQAFLVGPATEGGAVEQQVPTFEKRYETRLELGKLRKKLSDMVQAEGYTLRHLMPLDEGMLGGDED